MTVGNLVMFKDTSKNKRTISFFPSTTGLKHGAIDIYDYTVNDLTPISQYFIQNNSEDFQISLENNIHLLMYDIRLDNVEEDFILKIVLNGNVIYEDIFEFELRPHSYIQVYYENDIRVGSTPYLKIFGLAEGTYTTEQPLEVLQNLSVYLMPVNSTTARTFSFDPTTTGMQIEWFGTQYLGDNDLSYFWDMSYEAPRNGPLPITSQWTHMIPDGDVNYIGNCGIYPSVDNCNFIHILDTYNGEIIVDQLVELFAKTEDIYFDVYDSDWSNPSSAWVYAYIRAHDGRKIFYPGEQDYDNYPNTLINRTGFSKYKSRDIVMKPALRITFDPTTTGAKIETEDGKGTSYISFDEWMDEDLGVTLLQTISEPHEFIKIYNDKFDMMHYNIETLPTEDMLLHVFINSKLTKIQEFPASIGTNFIDVRYQFTGNDSDVPGAILDFWCRDLGGSNYYERMKGVDYAKTMHILLTPLIPTTPLVADFTFTASHHRDIQITDTSTGTPTSWYWDFGNGSRSVEQNPQWNYRTPGTYTITLTITNQEGSNTITRDITI